eukprot:2941842-Amphidinium_carterae.1
MGVAGCSEAGPPCAPPPPPPVSSKWLSVSASSTPSSFTPAARAVCESKLSYTRLKIMIAQTPLLTDPDF